MHRVASSRFIRRLALGAASDSLQEAKHRWMSKSAGKSAGNKTGSFLKLAIAKLDRALQVNCGKKPPPDLDLQPRQEASSTQDAVERIVCAATRGSLDKSLGPILGCSNDVAARVIRQIVRPDQAMEFFIWAAKQNGFKHDLGTCNQLLETLVRGARSLEAYELFKQRFSRMHKPDASSYMILVQGLSEARQMNEACELFNEMQKRGIQPGKGFLTNLLKGLVASGRLDDAIAYYQMMKESEKLDPASYCSMLTALSGHGRVDNAAGVMRDMVRQNCLPDLKTLSTHIELLCRNGRAMASRKLLHELSARGCQQDAVLQTFVMESLCGAGELREALQLFEEMGSSRRDLISFSVAVDGLWKAQRFDDAFRVMERMVREGCMPDVATFHSLLAAHYRMKRDEEVEEAAAGVVRKVRRKPTVVMYSVLIFGLCRTGEVEDALQLYCRMLSGTSPPSLLTFTVMIDGLGKAGRGMEAYKVFSDMIQRSVVPVATTYNALICGLCKAGCVDRVVELVKEMQEKRWKPDLKTFRVLIADGFGKPGRIDNAVACMKELGEIAEQ